MIKFKFKINEIFRSIQGEGIDTGITSVFVRLADCNLDCSFCDTNFETKFELSESELIEKIYKIAENPVRTKLIVFTGGEPLLQPIYMLFEKLKFLGFNIGVETNGTVPIKTTLISSLSLSPKVPIYALKQRWCNSLKLLFPYLKGATPNDVKESDLFTMFRFIQPIWKGDSIEENISIMHEATKEVLRLGDTWRLGLQIHKFINIQ